ncbi:MAG: VOC family protein [Pseudomonadales bacterium]|nr:VOC family protein [Halioglobus sp.]MCP5131411.1 VOC family protein [Pseudomonadales bacterium]
MEINGIAHTMLTAGDFAAARAFYSQLLPFMGLSPVLDSDGIYYCVGGKTAFGIRASEQASADNRFDQNRSGLHHICFRLRQREDVDELHGYLQTLGAHIVHPPREDGWAPGYYSVLFEDPEGIRLEANHVPGKGLLT